MVKIRTAFDKKTITVIAAGGLLVVAAFASLVLYLLHDGSGAAMEDAADVSSANGADDASTGASTSGSTQSQGPVPEPEPEPEPEPDSTGSPSGSGGANEDEEDEEDEEVQTPPVDIDPNPVLTLTPSVTSGRVPFDVKWRVTVQHMDIASLSWRLDVDGDGEPEAEGDGKPPAAPIYTQQVTEIGAVQARFTALDVDDTVLVTATVQALDACDGQIIFISDEAIDDADAEEEAHGQASEITCFFASRVEDTWSWHIRVADKTDLGPAEGGDPLAFYILADPLWGDQVYNELRVWWDGEELTKDWLRDESGTGGAYLSDSIAASKMEVRWEGNELIIEHPVNYFDTSLQAPAAGHKLDYVQLDAEIDHPHPTLNTRFDSVPQANEGPGYVVLEFDENGMAALAS